MGNDLKMVSDLKKIHPFPARMAPEILSAYLSSKKQLNIYDPMAGSGTSLVNALAFGHNVTGTDLDPLACLLARTWCSRKLDSDAFVLAEKIAQKVKRNWKNLKSAEAFPKHCDQETREFIKFWFDAKNRKQLTLLSNEISKLKKQKTRDFFWVAFSRLIIAKKRGVSLAMDLSHSRPHKYCSQAPISAVDHFEDSIKIVSQALKHNRSILKSGSALIKRGDARDNKIKSSSQHLILTSPPYLNAIDYMRCSKFSLVWMGYNLAELRDLRSQSIGSENARLKEISHISEIENILTIKMKVQTLSARKLKLLVRYSYDLNKVFSEVHRVLKKNGRAVFVVGNCFVENTKVNNAQLSINLAENNKLKLISKKTRKIPPNKRYMPPPTKFGKSDMNARMREEVVLEFRK